MQGGDWTPDDQIFHENGPRLGEEQGSDRAEVRALVAALEKNKEIIEVITDNQYVRDTAQSLAAGGLVHNGKHSDLWSRINNKINKLGHIRWVKEHLNKQNATAAGVNYEEWFGNEEADLQAKAGAEKH
eukprot:7084834-Heterocapsa_arctica.AAC.1